MKVNKFLSVIVSVSILCLPSLSFAFENNMYQPETIVSYETNPGIIVLEKNQNYENPMTGEYFRWENEGGVMRTSSNSVAKNFSFRIHTSVVSAKFDIDSSRVKVQSYGTLTHLSDGNIVDGTYDIELRNGWSYSETENFSTGSDSKKYSGLNPSKSCRITIKNDGSWDRYNYELSGEGTVYNIK